MFFGFVFSFSIYTDFTEYGFKCVILPVPKSNGKQRHPSGDERESDSSVGTSVSTRSQVQWRSQGEHKSDKIFQCKKCTYTGNSKESFIEHAEKAHGKILYGCEVFGCIKTFESLNGFRMHCKNYHKSQLSCELCGYVCVNEKAKQEHIDGHSKKTFVCTACSKTFTHDNDKDRHWLRHCPANPDRLTKCKQCWGQDKDVDVSGAEPGLMCHLSEVHNMSGAYLCSFCHTLFSSESRINKHNTVCTKKKPSL